MKKKKLNKIWKDRPQTSARALVKQWHEKKNKKQNTKNDLPLKTKYSKSPE